MESQLAATPKSKAPPSEESENQSPMLAASPSQQKLINETRTMTSPEQIRARIKQIQEVKRKAREAKSKNSAQKWAQIRAENVERRKKQQAEEVEYLNYQHEERQKSKQIEQDQRIAREREIRLFRLTERQLNNRLKDEEFKSVKEAETEELSRAKSQSDFKQSCNVGQVQSQRQLQTVKREHFRDNIQARKALQKRKEEQELNEILWRQNEKYNQELASALAELKAAEEDI